MNKDVTNSFADSVSPSLQKIPECRVEAQWQLFTPGVTSCLSDVTRISLKRLEFNSCGLHIRESSPEVIQGPSGAIISLTLPASIFVWSQKNYVSLLTQDPPERKSRIERELWKYQISLLDLGLSNFAGILLNNIRIIKNGFRRIDKTLWVTTLESWRE